MPGILPMKVIKVGSGSQARIAQACDRCRSKKIRCDGLRPCCSQCSNVGFECKTSDKLSRRAFPRGYTESLEERVRVLEGEIRELKDLLDAKDDKIDMLSRIRSNSPQQQYASRQNSTASTSSEAQAVKDALQQHGKRDTFKVHQSPELCESGGQEPQFVGLSSGRALTETLRRKVQESGKAFPTINVDSFFPTTMPQNACPSPLQPVTQWKGPPRLLSDQMVNVFFQEWAPLFPVLHRPSFLTLYEQYVSDAAHVEDQAALIQLNLVFGIAALSSKIQTSFDVFAGERHWLASLEACCSSNTIGSLQSLVLAQIYCIQKGDHARLLQYRSLAVGTAHRLGLHHSQKRFALDTLACETRKRVFWTQYTLDSFCAASLGCPRLINDSDVHCEFPVDADDEYISRQGIQPALPGESTKVSSALAFFRGARVLARVLTVLYPSAPTYDVSYADISSLSEELDAWSNSLPPHLRMIFAHEKPSTNVVSSRSPLLSLTYHYIRTLIHRPAAFARNGEHPAASIVALASSSKSIAQILALLEERNLSFSFCQNKTELLLLSGCGLLLQSVDLPKDSKLLRDSQHVVCSVVNMLDQSGASCADDFRRLGYPILSIRPSASPITGGPLSQRSTSMTSSAEDDKTALQREELHSIAKRYELALGHDSAEHHAEGRCATMPAHLGSVSPLQQTDGPRRFRALAPSSSSGRHSLQPGTRPASSSSLTLPLALKPLPPLPATPQRRQSSQRGSDVNLDYFSFMDSPAPLQSDGQSAPSDHQAQSSDFDNMISNLTGEQAHSPHHTSDSEWVSLNEMLSPLQNGPSTTSSVHGPTTAPSTAEDQWLHTSDLRWEYPPHMPLDLSKGSEHGGYSGTGHTATKPQSLLSFSTESLTSSGEEFSSLDVCSTGDSLVLPAFAEEGGANGFAFDEGGAEGVKV